SRHARAGMGESRPPCPRSRATLREPPAMGRKATGGGNRGGEKGGREVMELAAPHTKQPRQVRLLAYNARQAAKATGVGVRLLEKHRDEWKVPYKRLGGRVVYPVNALEKWLNSGV